MVLPSTQQHNVIHEARVQKLEGHDMVILRGYFDRSYVERLTLEMQRKFPGWDGLVVAIKPDEDFEVMPEPMARAIYERLERYFKQKRKKPTKPSRRKRRRARQG